MSRYGLSKNNKLKNFPHVYLINLEDHTHRLEKMKQRFSDHSVKEYTVSPAFDGRNSDLRNIVDGIYPKMRPQEIGCLASHLKAIKHWLDTSDSEYAIIMEDDCNFDTVEYWSWDWDYVMDNLPRNLDIFQMVMIKNDNVSFNIHKKEKFNYREKQNHSWSTACYLIKRSYAKYLVSKHCIDGKYNIYNRILKLNVADVLLYNFGNAYSMPLLTHDMDMKHSINSNHEDQHNNSKNNIDFWWKNKAKHYKKEVLFDINADLSKKEINDKEICFKIFHVDGESETSKMRTELTNRATKELTKSFNEIDTPTIIIKDKKEASAFFKNNKNIKIDPLGRFEGGWKYGELGIWASNFSAIKNFSKTEYNYLILMEDDIVIGKQFNTSLVKYMEELPEDWDFFTVYIPKTGNIRYRQSRDSIMIGKENVCKVYQSWSCLCYVVSKKGAERILELIKTPVSDPIDHWLFYHKGLNGYAIKQEKGNICNLYNIPSTVQEAEKYNMTGIV